MIPREEPPTEATSADPTSADELARARAAAAGVTDPELPFLTLADMGIVRGVTRATDGVIEVAITPTYSGCPAMDVIRIDLELALARAHVGRVRIVSQLSPPWTTDWLTTAARAKLVANGIAPPEQARGRRALFSEPEVACPRCGSKRTRLVSHFSSTACKAHWGCLACLEPFEQFKCI